MKIIVFLACVFWSMPGFSFQIKDVKDYRADYILISGSKDLCPEGKIRFKGQNEVLIGTQISIFDLDDKIREEGVKGLNCYFAKTKNSCKSSAGSYYIKSRNNIKNVKKEKFITVKSEIESWFYLDGVRQKREKILKIWGHKMQYKSTLYSGDSKKRSPGFKEVSSFICNYKTN